MKTPLYLIIGLIGLTLGCQPPKLDETKADVQNSISEATSRDNTDQTLEQLLDKSNAALAKATKDIIDLTASLKSSEEKKNQLNDQLAASQAEVAVLKTALADAFQRFEQIQTGMADMKELLKPFAPIEQPTTQEEVDNPDELPLAEEASSPEVKTDKGKTDKGNTLPKVKTAESNKDSSSPQENE